ncbi:MAG: energy transducer TonB [Aureispira sp.]|nr:energy transducer TonB [Aureispira sp.]
MKHVFINTIILLFLGVAVATAQSDEPRFPGCSDAEDVDCADMKMMQFIFSNLKHPEEAISAGVKGEVVVFFTVKASGDLAEISISEGLGHGCDEEVLRVIGMMPKWLPAEADGQAVDMEWEIGVTFK